MKLITAIIQPFRLDDVMGALQEAGVAGVTLSEANGFGRQRGHTEVYRGATYDVQLVPKIRLEILTEDELVEDTISAVLGAAHTGQIGDGKIWLTDVHEVVRVRTGERGATAL